MTTVLSPTSSRRLNQDSKVLKKVEEHIVERCVLKSSKHRIESLRQYWRSDHNKTAGLIQALREASKSHNSHCCLEKSRILSKPKWTWIHSGRSDVPSNELAGWNGASVSSLVSRSFDETAASEPCSRRYCSKSTSTGSCSSQADSRVLRRSDF